jgi:hypothetical protein
MNRLLTTPLLEAFWIRRRCDHFDEWSALTSATPGGGWASGLGSPTPIRATARRVEQRSG